MRDVCIALLAGLTGVSLGLVAGCCLLRSRAYRQVAVVEIIRRSRPSAKEVTWN